MKDQEDGLLSCSYMAVFLQDEWVLLRFFLYGLLKCLNNVYDYEHFFS